MSRPGFTFKDIAGIATAGFLVLVFYVMLFAVPILVVIAAIHFLLKYW